MGRLTALGLTRSRRAGSRLSRMLRPMVPTRSMVSAAMVAVEGSEHGRGCLADGGVGAGIGRIGRDDREREPRRVTGNAGVADGVTELDRGDRAPHQVVVFRVVERDGGVGQGEVQVLEHGDRPLQAGVPGHGELLGDLIPYVPDG
jgi:hypothetical protein